MLSTATISDAATSSSSVRVKNLDATLTRDEQKDLEPDFELEEPANNEKREDSVAEIHDGDQEEAASSTPFSLSSRALAVQSYLRDTTSVKAIVLRQDGSAEEVSYDGSSSSTRRLLGGRPSVVGEIEALKLLVVQPLSEDSSVGAAAANSHTLPVPLCHHRAHGDYVLFRVDSEGKAGDVSLSEYQKYVEDHKTLTETALKNYSAESEQIRCSSPRALYQSTKLLRGAVEAQIFGESETVDLSDAEIQNAVKEGLQKLVDEAVAESTASPMEDPDYSPEDDAEEQQDEEQGAEGIVHAFDSSVDDRPWRSQLEDAMKHIQEIGKLDGAVFAQMISATFYELNGTEPALDQLATLFAKIREEFANEAQEELDEDIDSETETESEADAETETESEGEVDEEWRGTLDRIRRIGRIDGEALAEQICDAFYDENGEELSLEELAEIWEGAQDALAAEAQEMSDGEDTEYDPDSETDRNLEERDAAEDRLHELRYFGGESESESEVDEEWQETLDHVRSIAKRDGRVLVNNICDAFYDDNGEELSLEELTGIWQGIQDELAEEAEEGLSDESDAESDVASDTDSESFEGEEEEESLDGDYDPNNMADTVWARWDLEADIKHQREHFDALLLSTPVVASESGSAVAWTLYFNEQQLCPQAERSNLVRAANSFRHQKRPTIYDLKQMAKFLAVPEVSGDAEEDLIAAAPDRSRLAPSSLLVSPVAEKKTAKRFNVYLEDSKLSQKETEDIAIKWFNRINHRAPEEEDMAKIRAFIQKEANLKEQEFLVPAQSLTFGEDDAAVTEDDGDDEEAIEWFKRFNGRTPNEEESLKMKEITTSDDEEMVNID